MHEENIVKPETKRPRPGRRRLFVDGLIDTHISITPIQRDWLDSQPDVLSETIRHLIDDAMKKEKQNR